ncbi:MAG: hypothetical protein JOY90_12175 [Bradyrhizobium sp.]|uniref:hypothetical protein n=1 Tax=Bradyrhizobium sp. TaxID=376 RepID=UPI001E13A722|nr:hypothetical protein [Bradyrhizobium sp.]MBV9561195.1 hypothetical protein [Bradyrhizobium sp.]
MRLVISGVIAAFAVMTAGAAPAMACGFTACSPCATYLGPCTTPAYTYAPTYTTVPSYVGYDRLADPETDYDAGPEHQYYYVNEGPTYTGPGAFAPYPTYRGGYRHHAYRWHHRYTFYPHRHSLRYGYAPQHHAWHTGYGYGRRGTRRYD